VRFAVVDKYESKLYARKELWRSSGWAAPPAPPPLPRRRRAAAPPADALHRRDRGVFIAGEPPVPSSSAASTAPAAAAAASAAPAATAAAATSAALAAAASAASAASDASRREATAAHPAHPAPAALACSGEVQRRRRLPDVKAAGWQERVETFNRTGGRTRQQAAGRGAWEGAAA